MHSFQEKPSWLRIFVVAFSLVIIVSSGFYTKSLYQVSVGEMQESLNVMGKRLEVQLDSRLMALALLADDVEVRSLETDDLAREIQRPVQLLSLHNIGVYDREGHLITQAGKSLPNQIIYTFKPVFSQVLQGERVITDRYKGNQGEFIGLMVPIYDNVFQIKGVLVGELSLSTLASFLGKETEQRGYFCVLDSSQQIVYHTHIKSFADLDQERLLQENLFQERNMLYSESRFLEHRNWNILLAKEKMEVYHLVLIKAFPQLTLALAALFSIGLLYRKWHQERLSAENMKRLRFERLISVNQLAAGLAHEVRNPLTSIKGFIQLMDKKGDQPPVKNHIQIILAEIERINKLIGEFQHLARPLENPRFIRVSMGKVVDDVITLMKSHCVHKNVNLVASFKGEWTGSSEVKMKMDSVIGDEGQLKQVLINIIKNAVDAVDKNGEIQVTLKYQENQVIVDIEDNGKGMSEDVLHKVGTPFFTTKEDGNGLGLSVCFNIIESHNGTIQVKSQEGKGTVFSVALPYAQ